MSNTKEEKEFMKKAYSHDTLSKIFDKIEHNFTLSEIEYNLNTINFTIEQAFIVSLVSGKKYEEKEDFSDMYIEYELESGVVLKFSQLSCSDVYHYTDETDSCEITVDFAIESSENKFLSGDICFSITINRDNDYTYDAEINYDNEIYNMDYYKNLNNLDRLLPQYDAIKSNCKIIRNLLRLVNMSIISSGDKV